MISSGFFCFTIPSIDNNPGGGGSKSFSPFSSRVFSFKNSRPLDKEKFTLAKDVKCFQKLLPKLKSIKNGRLAAPNNPNKNNATDSFNEPADPNTVWIILKLEETI